MVRPYLTPGTAGQITEAFSRLDATFRMFWADAFVVMRRALVDDGRGGKTQTWQPVTQSAGVPTVGRLLSSNRMGGERVVAQQVVGRTQYDFRLDGRVDIQTDDELVVNGTRRFAVVAIDQPNPDDLAMTITLEDRT